MTCSPRLRSLWSGEPADDPSLSSAPAAGAGALASTPPMGIGAGSGARPADGGTAMTVAAAAALAFFLVGCPFLGMRPRSRSHLTASLAACALAAFLLLKRAWRSPNGRSAPSSDDSVHSIE